LGGATRHLSSYDLSSNKSVESKEVSPGVVLYYDSSGNLVGIDIDNASKKLDLNELIVNHLPYEKQIIAA
jgi:uncharacterized protein YuzE